MQRFAILPLLFASACLGSITGGDESDPKDPPVQPPEPVTDVRVTVRDATDVQAGVKVVFQATDDSVIAEGVTDSSGAVTAKMPNGGNVTVIRTYGPNVYGEPGPIDQVFTYVGVKPGDNIELVGTLRDDTPYIAKVNVGLSNGEFVAIQTPCGQGYGHAPTIEVQLKGCGSQTDFFVINYSGETDEDGVNSGPLYFATHANLAPTIDLTGETFRGTLSTEVIAANMPQMAVSLQKRLVLGNFTLFDTGMLGAPTATTDVPELPNAEQIVSAHVTDYAGTMLVMSARSQFSSAPITIDVAAGMIPTSQAPALSGTMLTWTEQGTGTPDVAFAQIQVGAVDRQFVRSIAAPYSATKSMQVPTLPAAYAKYNVQTGDTPTIMHSLARITGGYDAARARIFGSVDLAPVGGTATIAYPSTSTQQD